MPSPPALGALGFMFTSMRALQFVALISIIGLTGNFVSETVASDYTAPSALVGTLVVACLCTVYIITTYILYWDSLLPLLISTGADAVCLIAVIVVACLVGKPVSYLKCEEFPAKGNTAIFVDSLFRNVNAKHSKSFIWVDASKTSCFELKSVWGLTIALCVLFAFSSITSACLWKRVKGGSSRPAPKDFE